MTDCFLYITSIRVYEDDGNCVMMDNLSESRGYLLACSHVVSAYGSMAFKRYTSHPAKTTKLQSNANTMKEVR